MSSVNFVEPDAIREQFSQAMSAMYVKEVPMYQQLKTLVADINGDEHRHLNKVHHGAIRLGTANELQLIRRLFAVMGMQAVGYYDLSVANLPVHSTAFRPVKPSSLQTNPFRVFTSLLRLDLIEDKALSEQASVILAKRSIINHEARALIDTYEAQGGLTQQQAERFVLAALETFRWHEQAQVDQATYQQLKQNHALIADIVSFKGPHINHLTPATVFIDNVQAAMQKAGMQPKDTIEGAPLRACPILLRQTSFMALTESVLFKEANGSLIQGKHTARFGEIEQRGAALTTKGRALYDRLLLTAKATYADNKSDGQDYETALAQTFAAFADDWQILHKEGLAYFSYTLNTKARISMDALTAEQKQALHRLDQQALIDTNTWQTLLEQGIVLYTPIQYEDFLPVSAAGIFASNLADNQQTQFTSSPNQAVFETALGVPVIDPCVEYAKIQQQSIIDCYTALQALLNRS